MRLSTILRRCADRVPDVADLGGVGVLLESDQQAGFEKKRDLLGGELLIVESHHSANDEEVVVVHVGLGTLGDVEGILGREGVEAERLDELLDDPGVQAIDVDPADRAVVGSGFGEEGGEVGRPGDGESLGAVVGHGERDGARGRGGVAVLVAFEARDAAGLGWRSVLGMFTVRGGEAGETEGGVERLADGVEGLSDGGVEGVADLLADAGRPGPPLAGRGRG